MKVRLAYGRAGIEVEFPDTNVDIIEPRFVDGLPDEGAALREALRQPIGTRPLRELVGTEDSVAVIFSDRTRPMPSDRVLPIVLSELENTSRENITLINAVGTHRHNTAEELEAMLGRRIVDGVLSGLHEASSSHFALLEAFAERTLLEEAVDAATSRGYLAHEFGDACLVLGPERRARHAFSEAAA